MDIWKKASLPLQSTIRDAIKNLENSAVQICFILSQNGSLVGTITDGDIRRGLLNGFTLDSEIYKLVMKNPLVVPKGVDKLTALNIMKMNKIHQLLQSMRHIL